ncbi:hypothetical protein C4K03_0931 [Pseudomonas synxantha]|uniref:Uncharacterized protein n=1 Tax=Pseudomonas synxantha TaxID=47883 RepID=A0A3G7U340_9PSED|nr:hypothetical protein [Pseudomonas synxantha]AZE53102.1 hypothetical protein C4K03_0931 [Pseudomonas synxantha]
MATGHLCGLLGEDKFEATVLTLTADADSEDFVIQAKWTANNGARELTFYIPERYPDGEDYPYGSLAGAYYEVARKSFEWESGSITRKAVDFSSPDLDQWRAVIDFNVKVTVEGTAIWIKGEGELTGASPWGKKLRQRYPFSSTQKKPLSPS